MASTTIYVTLRYDPHYTRAADLHVDSVFQHAVALKLPPPRKATFQRLGAHAGRFSWVIASPKQEPIRISIINVDTKQKTDEELRQRMKKRGILHIEWFEQSTPTTSATAALAKRPYTPPESTNEDNLGRYYRSKRPRIAPALSSSSLDRAIASTTTPRTTSLLTPPYPPSSSLYSLAPRSSLWAGPNRSVYASTTSEDAARPSLRPLEHGEGTTPSLPTPPHEPAASTSKHPSPAEPTSQQLIPPKLPTSLAPAPSSSTPPALAPHLSHPAAAPTQHPATVTAVQEEPTARPAVHEADISALRTAFAAAHARADAADARSAAADALFAAHADELRVAREELARVKREAEQMRAEREDSRIERDELRSNRDSLRDVRDALTTERDAARRELDELKKQPEAAPVESAVLVMVGVAMRELARRRAGRGEGM